MESRLRLMDGFTVSVNVDEGKSSSLSNRVGMCSTEVLDFLQIYRRMFEVLV